MGGVREKRVREGFYWRGKKDWAHISWQGVGLVSLYIKGGSGDTEQKIRENESGGGLLWIRIKKSAPLLEEELRAGHTHIELMWGLFFGGGGICVGWGRGFVMIVG